MLALDRVGKIYPNGVNALERFSAEIRLGEIVAVKLALPPAGLYPGRGFGGSQGCRSEPSAVR